ncbi:MAG: cytoplasmic protein [Desulfobacteraceae bacterium]|nr:cytoplasmic protein [Desulfobacteraceae bacterium]
MLENEETPNNLDFVVDKDHLYREEIITDLKVATIRQLTPVKLDGSDDSSREPIFMGSTQLTTPQGPIPLQAELGGATLEEAMDQFPQVMEVETRKVIENFKRMHEQQKKENDSRIIMPGMG